MAFFNTKLVASIAIVAVLFSLFAVAHAKEIEVEKGDNYITSGNQAKWPEQVGGKVGLLTCKKDAKTYEDCSMGPVDYDKKVKCDADWYRPVKNVFEGLKEEQKKALPILKKEKDNIVYYAQTQGHVGEGHAVVYCSNSVTAAISGVVLLFVGITNFISI